MNSWLGTDDRSRFGIRSDGEEPLLRTPKSESRNPQFMGFETFLGNRKAVETVRGLLASGRVPGAMLFTGPEGVGKKTLALMLAKAVNCERRAGGDGFCGECPRCRKADEMLAATREDLERRREIKDATRRSEGLVYFDLQLIEPITKFILIEQIRQLRSVAYTRPFEFSRRVFVIDAAQAIHWQAVDLLLKVLEEPPETTMLILVCSNAFALRPTIRSRCLRVPFQPVDDVLIREVIAQEARVPKAKQELALRVAAGSVAVAKTFDPAEFERRRQPWMGFLESITRSSPDGTTQPNWETLFRSTKALTENREDFEGTLRTGYLLLRDLELVCEAGKEPPVANVDILPHLKAWADRLGLRGVERLKEGLDQAHRQQVRNVNQQLGFESLAVEILAAGPALPTRAR
jgi:DNA polymerase-3 subunit delta'